MKVLIVDDHVLFREGLVNLLSTDPSFQVVGQASSVREAVEQARKLKPELILMDFSLPDGDGAEASAAILRDLPDCNIVFLTMHDADEKLFAAIRSGAKGYLLKNVPVSQLLIALHAVEKGEAAISRTMMRRVMDGFSRSGNGSRTESGSDALSPREVEILRAIGSGATNQEIAAELFLSVNTVKHHVHSILSKFGVDSRREAIQYAQKTGLIKKG